MRGGGRARESAVDARAGIPTGLSPPAFEPPHPRAAAQRAIARLAAPVRQQPHPVHRGRGAGLAAAHHRRGGRRSGCGARCRAALPPAQRRRAFRTRAPAGLHRTLARPGRRAQRPGHRVGNRRMRTCRRRRSGGVSPGAPGRRATGARAAHRRASRAHAAVGTGIARIGRKFTRRPRRGLRHLQTTQPCRRGGRRDRGRRRPGAGDATHVRTRLRPRDRRRHGARPMRRQPGVGRGHGAGRCALAARRRCGERQLRGRADPAAGRGAADACGAGRRGRGAWRCRGDRHRRGGRGHRQRGACGHRATPDALSPRRTRLRADFRPWTISPRPR